MPKPRRLSGADIIKIFEEFGFTIKNQRGSHIKLTRSCLGTTQALLVSNHKELKTGAIVGIFKQALQYIPEPDLRSHFYSE